MALTTPLKVLLAIIAIGIVILIVENIRDGDFGVAGLMLAMTTLIAVLVYRLQHGQR